MVSTPGGNAFLMWPQELHNVEQQWFNVAKLVKSATAFCSVALRME
jgi:hypothetical protein